MLFQSIIWVNLVSSNKVLIREPFFSMNHVSSHINLKLYCLLGFDKDCIDSGYNWKEKHIKLSSPNSPGIKEKLVGSGAAVRMLWRGPKGNTGEPLFSLFPASSLFFSFLLSASSHHSSFQVTPTTRPFLQQKKRLHITNFPQVTVKTYFYGGIIYKGK